MLISNSGEHRFFMALSNSKKPIVLSQFDSNGNGFCNYNNGNIRFQLNCIGGINFNTDGSIIRKWLFPTDASNLLAFHPIIFQINECMSFQIHNKFKILFQFRSRFGSCKFLIKLNSVKNADDFNHFKLGPNDKTCSKLKTKAE